MPKYRPVLMDFNDEGYQLELKIQKEKQGQFKQAYDFATKYIVVVDYEKFAKSFTQFFKTEWYAINKSKIALDVSIDKLLDLVNIDLTPLQKLEAKFNSTPHSLDFNEVKDGIATINVDRKKYEVYTKSAQENETLRDAKNFIDALHRLERHTKVYPLNIANGTNGLIRFDIRKQMYFPSVRPKRG